MSSWSIARHVTPTIQQQADQLPPQKALPRVTDGLTAGLSMAAALTEPRRLGLNEQIIGVIEQVRGQGSWRLRDVSLNTAE